MIFHFNRPWANQGSRRSLLGLVAHCRCHSTEQFLLAYLLLFLQRCGDTRVNLELMRRFNDLEIPDPFLEYEMFQLRRGPDSWGSPNLPVTLDLKSGDVLFSKTTNYRPLQVFASFKMLTKVDHEGRPNHRPDLGDLPSLSGRSNLVAASKQTQHIFVAHEDMIGISNTPSGPRFMFGVYDQMIPKPYPDDESVGYLVDDIVVTIAQYSLTFISHMELQTCMLVRLGVRKSLWLRMTRATSQFISLETISADLLSQ